MKRVGDGMEYFARVEKVKITQGNGFHILAVGNTVIIFADVTSCSPRAYRLNYGWYHYHKNTQGRNCVFCHSDEHYFLFSLKSSISFLELKISS